MLSYPRRWWSKRCYSCGLRCPTLCCAHALCYLELRCAVALAFLARVLRRGPPALAMEDFRCRSMGDPSESSTPSARFNPTNSTNAGCRTTAGICSACFTNLSSRIARYLHHGDTCAHPWLQSHARYRHAATRRHSAHLMVEGLLLPNQVGLGSLNLKLVACRRFSVACNWRNSSRVRLLHAHTPADGPRYTIM